jgi:hypothetical protein
MPIHITNGQLVKNQVEMYGKRKPTITLTAELLDLLLEPGRSCIY